MGEALHDRQSEHRPAASVPEPSWMSGIEAGSAAGIVGGFLIGGVYGIITAIEAWHQSFVTWALAPVIALGGALIGLLVASVPGAIIAMMLQRNHAANLGPFVGALLGGLGGLGLFVWLGDSRFDQQDVAGVLFVICGMLGGLAGGLVLKRSVGSL